MDFRPFQAANANYTQYGTVPFRRRRTCGSWKCLLIFGLLLACVGAFASMMAFTMYVNSNHTYRAKLEVRIEAYEDAKTFFYSDVCQSDRLKNQLGERNKCNMWNKTISSPPEDLAMNDWMEAYTLCKPGECLVTSFSMTQLITQVIPAIAFFVVLLILTITYCVWDICIKRDEREMEIPLTNIAAQIASQAQSMFLASMQSVGGEKNTKLE
jgi:hypothetical protein